MNENHFCAFEHVLVGIYMGGSRKRFGLHPEIAPEKATQIHRSADRNRRRYHGQGCYCHFPVMNHAIVSRIQTVHRGSIMHGHFRARYILEYLCNFEVF